MSYHLQTVMTNLVNKLTTFYIIFAQLLRKSKFWFTIKYTLKIYKKENVTKLFADDSNIISEIIGQIYIESLQNDLYALGLNVEKCKVMHFGKSISKFGVCSSSMEFPLKKWIWQNRESLKKGYQNPNWFWETRVWGKIKKIMFEGIQSKFSFNENSRVNEEQIQFMNRRDRLNCFQCSSGLT